MKQEDKELLLKDLCSRLPYEIKGKTAAGEVTSLIRRGKTDYDIITSINIIIEKHGWRPYLFPLSSMIKEQKKYIRDKHTFGATYELFDWFDKNHFDYRGLIDKGLAIDCTNLNIY